MTVKNGQLPKGWREAQLGEFMEFKNGLNTRKENYGSGVKFVNVMDVFSHNYLYADDVIGSVQVTKKQLVDYSVKYGDVLFNRTSETFEEIAMSSVYLDKKEIIFGGFVIRGRQKSNILVPEYSAYCFQTHTVRRELIRRGQGAVRVNIGQKDLSKIPIVIPPVNEQKAIASLLEKWDTVIERTEALIEAKEKRFKWLLKTLISDQQDNPEWRKVKLGDVFGKQLVIEKGKMLTLKQVIPGDFPVIASGQNYASFHNDYTHNTKTITISGSGAYAGFIWFHDYPIFATDCNVITAVSGIMEYFYYAIKIHQNRLYSLQSGGAQPHIYAKDIAVLDIVIPSIKEQKSIAYQLDTAQREIDLLKQLAEQYHTHKRGLMQKLLTGKWRINPNTKAEDVNFIKKGATSLK
ncbi:MAG: restriction endonuclease subunit S [Ekhidna sp.]|nr:restriction endonuclease subunit S [Ekhidna sp.]